MRRIVPSAIVVLMALSLTNCSMPSQTQGPRTWIDQPLDGAHLPLTALTIQAHASDADGVTTIEFYVAESLLATAPVNGGRLGEATVEWTPPGPGVYIISAGAVDSQGNAGSKASVKIVVETADPGTATPTPVPASLECAVGALAAPVLLSPADGTTVGLEPVLAWSYPDETCHPHSYRIDISEDASFTDVGLGFGTLDYNELSRQWPLPAGKCYYWRALAYVPDVNGPASPTWHFCIAETTGPSFTLTQNANCREGPGTAYEAIETLMQGQTVPIEGRNADSSWFWVVKKPGSSGHCWVSVVTGQVLGDINAVQVVSAPPPPEPAADTTPPEIDNLSADPASLQTGGCGEPSVTVVSARVSDDGGVSRVVARIPGSGEVEMGSAGGDLYQAVLGPFYDGGELSIIVIASDNAGNHSQAGPLTITVACIQ